MRNIAFAIGAAMALTATPAFAATLLLGAGGPNYDEKIHENHAGSGQTLVLKTKPTGYLVDFSVPAGETIDVGAGDGFAFVGGPFSQITIDPQDVLGQVLGFTAIGFNLDFEKHIGQVEIPHPTKPGKTKKVDPLLSFKILVTFADASTQLFDTGFAPNTKFDILADSVLGEIMTSIKIYDLIGTVEVPGDDLVFSYDFDNIRQVSFDAAPVIPIPEPATWAMMIGGFGLVGGALRRRRGKIEVNFA